MLALPPLHNRYYGGADTPALRIMNVNRAGLAISPSRLADFHRDPQVRRDVWDQIRGILYADEIREATAEQGSFTRLVVRGLQWLWLGTVVVVLPRRGVPGVTKALLLVPLLYLIVYVFYDVDIYYPRHLIAGYLGLGISALYAVGRAGAPRKVERPRPRGQVSEIDQGRGRPASDGDPAPAGS